MQEKQKLDLCAHYCRYILEASDGRITVSFSTDSTHTMNAKVTTGAELRDWVMKIPIEVKLITLDPD